MKIRNLFALILCICLCLTLCACGGGKDNSLPTPTDFVMDETTGEFSFTGVEGADHYYVWLHSYDTETGEEGPEPAASKRLGGGTGTISGALDMDDLIYSAFIVKLIAYAPAGDASISDSEPAIYEFSHSGNLSVPDFGYEQNGTSVTFHVSQDSLKNYAISERVTSYKFYLYDEAGKLVQETAPIENIDWFTSTAGPMLIYNFSVSSIDVTVPEGTYTVKCQAIGDDYSTDSAMTADENVLTLVVAAGTTSSGQNYEASSASGEMGGGSGEMGGASGEATAEPAAQEPASEEPASEEPASAEPAV